MVPVAGVVGLLLVMTLAGCSGAEENPLDALDPVDCAGPREGIGVRNDPDISRESLTWYVNSTGSYEVVLPYIVHPRVTRASWLHNMTPQLDSMTLTGRGNQVVTACVSLIAKSGDMCCAEDFLGGRWVGGGEENQMPVQVKSGSIHLDVVYTAASNYCGGTERGGGAFSPGTHRVATDGNMGCE